MRIYPASLNSMYVEWSLAGETFSVYRSTSPQDDFEPVGIDIVQPFFIDESANLYDENIRYYYKVEGFLNGEKVSEDGPDTLFYNVKDPVAGKVIYEASVVLKAMRNPPVFFLLKRRSGMPCPECYNPITKKVSFANCDRCNGTGFLQGYHTPIVARISQDVSQLVMASGELDGDKVALTPIRAWIENTPLVTPEDVMVDIMNQRYKIVSVSRRTRSQFVIRQVLDLVPLEKGHPVYKVDVDRTVKF